MTTVAPAPATTLRSFTPAPRLLALAIAVLAGLTAVYTLWPITRAGLPLQIDPNEAWNAWLVDRLRQGEPLYPDPAGLIVNNYPPLSFWTIDALAAVTGVDALYVGRALSIVALAAAALAVAGLIRQFQASWTAALVGAIWFVASLTRFIDHYVGMNDPNLPALALMAWALVWFVKRAATGRAPDAAVALMVVAGFYKHSLFAIPLTAIAWLALRDRRAALRAAAVGAVLAAIGLTLCAEAFSPVFLANLLMPRDHSLLRALIYLKELQGIAPALGVVFVWIWHRRDGDAVRFARLFVGIGLAVYVVARLGDGIDNNAQFELDVAVAVALGLAFHDVRAMPAPFGFDASRQRILIVALLILRIVLVQQVTPYLWLASPSFRAELDARRALAASEVARIAAIPGPVICSVDLICRFAGKPYLLDGFYLEQAAMTGRRTAADVERAQRALGARVEPVDPRTLTVDRFIGRGQQAD